MPDDTRIPRSVKIVAYLFLFGGICSAIEMGIALTRGGININFGVLGIPICWGLLNGRNGWRICGLVFLWIGLIVAPVVFLIGLFGNVPGDVAIFGIKVGRIAGWIISVACVPLFLLILWEYRVLVKPNIKALFKPSDVQSPGPSGPEMGT